MTNAVLIYFAMTEEIVEMENVFRKSFQANLVSWILNVSTVFVCYLREKSLKEIFEDEGKKTILLN